MNYIIFILACIQASKSLTTQPPFGCIPDIKLLVLPMYINSYVCKYVTH